MEPLEDTPSYPPNSDAAGAALVVVGLLGVVAWAWELVRTQFVDDGGSLGERLDLLVEQIPVLLLSGLVGGVGIALRSLAASRTGAPARPALGRPVGRIALAVAAGLGVVLGGAALMGTDEPELVDLTGFSERLERGEIEIIPPPAFTKDLAPPATLREVNHTLEVHTDGCGVFRSGEIGDDLTWVIKDLDGFQVLGRNAAGETQYRYFRPGTYTVVLEAWGGDHYREVSNEVTIAC